MYHNEVIGRHRDRLRLKSNKVRVGIEYYIGFPLYSRGGYGCSKKATVVDN